MAQRPLLKASMTSFVVLFRLKSTDVEEGITLEATTKHIKDCPAYSPGGP